MLWYKFHSFIHTLVQVMHNFLHVYIIHLYTFLVKITSFVFKRVLCSIVNSIICNFPIFWTKSSFLRVFITNYCIFFMFNFRYSPALISKLHHFSLDFFPFPSSLPPEPHTYLYWGILGKVEEKRGTWSAGHHIYKSVKGKNTLR